MREVYVTLSSITALERSTMASQEGDIKPEDSVSQCNVSTTSTSASKKARIQALARKAALDAEYLALSEQQELELQHLRIQQRRAELDLKTKLSCVEAEEKVFAQFEEQKSTVSNSPSPQANSPPQAELSCEETMTYPIEHSQESQKKQSTTDEPIMGMLHQAEIQQRSLIETLQLPKAELMFYDGEPLKFWEFWRAFEINVDSTSIPDAAKITRLLHYCKGDARKVIQACSVMESTKGYLRAKALLKERFGNKHKVADAWIKKVTKGATVSAHNSVALREMADELQVCYETLQAVGYESEMNPQSFLKSIVERLPNYLRYRWIRIVRDIQKKHDRTPKMKDLVSFMEDVAEEENNPVYGSVSWKSSRDNKSGSSPQNKSDKQRSRGAFSVTMATNELVTKRCLLCKADHTLFGCQQFKGMTPQDRLNYARQEKLCFNCLRKGHMTMACRLNRTCSVAGCGRKHTKFLHIPQPQEEMTTPSTTQQEAPVQNGYIDSAEDTSCSNITGAGSRSVLPIVPVRVQASEGSNFVRTYALLDTGSTNTFCTEQIAEQLGVKGTKQKLNLTTLEKIDSTIDTTMVSLVVDSGPTTERVEMPKVYTKSKINVHGTHMAKMGEISGLPHLKGINLPFAGENEVGLLIGQDVPEALLPP